MQTVWICTTHFQLTSLMQNYLSGTSKGWYRKLWNFRKKKSILLLTTDSLYKAQSKKDDEPEQRGQLSTTLPQMQDHNPLYCQNYFSFLTSHISPPFIALHKPRIILSYQRNCYGCVCWAVISRIFNIYWNRIGYITGVLPAVLTFYTGP